MFLRLLEEQRKLDLSMKGSRERDFFDVMLSAIAEVIEYNEACDAKVSHKTWKRKTPYNIKEEKEELADVFIFVLQAINHLCIDFKDEVSYMNDFETLFLKGYENFDSDTSIKSVTSSIINDFSSCNLKGAYYNLGILSNYSGMNLNWFYDTVYNKIKYNFVRTDRVLQNS